ncbi:MAG: protein-tyrosine-phosphatase [Pirellulaceae bacterium]
MKIPKLPIVIVVCTITSICGVTLNAQLLETIRPFVDRVEHSLESLPAQRKEMLGGVVDYVMKKLSTDAEVQLIFICTHNSRRSHISQIWCHAAALHYGVEGVTTWSGGTEATACNIRTVRALRRAGVAVVATTDSDNPMYLVQIAENDPPLRVFSKVYSEDGNPVADFAAMMCCSDVDSRCPVVFGADGRFALHYDDPKVADDTPEEASRYDERNFQIACEMFYVMSETSRRMRSGHPATQTGGEK